MAKVESPYREDEPRTKSYSSGYSEPCHPKDPPVPRTGSANSTQSQNSSYGPANSGRKRGHRRESPSPEDDYYTKPYINGCSEPCHPKDPPVPRTGSANSTQSQDSSYGSANSGRKRGHRRELSASASFGPYIHATVLGDTKGSTAPGFGPAKVYDTAPGRSIESRETKVPNKGILHCLHADCELSTKRQDDLDRHQKSQNTLPGPEEKFDCPAKGCVRTGEHSFDRKDHLREHLRKAHEKDILELSRRKRDPAGDDGRYDTTSEAPSEQKAQGDNYSEVPPSPPMESVEYTSPNLKPSELTMTTIVEPPQYTGVEIPETTDSKLPKTTIVVGAEAHSSKLERHRIIEDLRKVYREDTPKAIKRNSGVGRNTPGDIGRPNSELKAPSQLKAQDRDHKDMPPLPLVKAEKIVSRDQKSIKLSRTSVLIGNSSNLEYARFMSSQSLHIAEKSPGTTSGGKLSVSHIVDDEDKESSRSIDLERVRYVQVTPEPQAMHDKSIPQGVKLNYEHNGLYPIKKDRLSSAMTADAERSTVTITGEHGVRDAVKPAKIVSEPDNEARPNRQDHVIHTTPLTVMDAEDGPMSSLSDDRIEQAQDDNDSSVVDDSCSNFNPVEHLANVMTAEDAAQTSSSGESIEPAEDLNDDQTPINIPKAIMNLDDTIMRALMSSEDRISGHIHPVGLSENVINVKDTDQTNTSGSSMEAVDDQSPHLAYATEANPTPLRMVSPYDAYVMTLLGLRIELRVWLGRRAPSPIIHISTSGETLLEDGKQRIRWTCRCGRRLYDDFEELRPGALDELEQMLNEQRRICSAKGNGSSQHRRGFIDALRNAAGGIIGSSTGSRPSHHNTLPLHQHHAAGKERYSQSSATSENLFLLMCIPYRKHGTRLVHMDLSELISDETLFRKLRQEYQSIRGHWASYFSLWRMAEIQFVKFGLHKHQLIDIKAKNDLPPANLEHEYRYRPIPAEIIPPIGTNRLMHLYEHPDHADDLPFCLERIPKKVGEQLKLSPHQVPGLLGWGVYFAEGFDWPKFWVFGSVIISLSVLFGVCWSTLRQDIQGGFGITACMMVAVTFTTGVLQAAVEQK